MDHQQGESVIDRELHTLDSWRRGFSVLPLTIECSTMKLWGKDQEGEIFQGPGRIEIYGDAKIRFYLYGAALDEAVAFRKFRAAKAQPYDALEQFRLFATDYSGVEWTGGWTEIDFFADHKHGWPLTGELSGLSTRVTGYWVANSSSVELLLIPPVDVPMNEVLVSTSSIGAERIEKISSRGRQSLQALGTTVTFVKEPSGEALWITAQTSPELLHPFAERWLTEPLRILLGAPIYPQLIARNFGDGTAMVTFLPAPRRRNPSLFGLMQPFGLDRRHDEVFWKLYVDILAMVAATRSNDGGRNLENHELTRLYEELIQTRNGSRWVMLLTLASTIEALVKTLMTDADRKSDFSDSALKNMEEYISRWDGDSTLRSRMLSNLAMVRERSVLAFMRSLANRNLVESEHVSTWQRLRNSVMHGHVVEPWASEESDRHLREMIILVHSLTRVRIAKG